MDYLRSYSTTASWVKWQNAQGKPNLLHALRFSQIQISKVHPYNFALFWIFSRIYGHRRDQEENNINASNNQAMF